MNMGLWFWWSEQVTEGRGDRVEHRCWRLWTRPLCRLDSNSEQAVQYTNTVCELKRIAKDTDFGSYRMGQQHRLLTMEWENAKQKPFLLFSDKRNCWRRAAESGCPSVPRYIRRRLKLQHNYSANLCAVTWSPALVSRTSRSTSSRASISHHHFRDLVQHLNRFKKMSKFACSLADTHALHSHGSQQKHKRRFSALLIACLQYTHFKRGIWDIMGYNHLIYMYILAQYPSRKFN